ncbi:syncytin-1-like [Molossus molossus]|uniref:syncytin-1-like n=1 Tax=Molossus molossus TaxID=27622 RepID=UPI001746A899|nr:syncytin-1-like [Molossus molossus]
MKVIPTSSSRIVDCGTKTAYLEYIARRGGGYTQSWVCVEKPTIIPVSDDGKPGPCPTECKVASQMHSICYQDAQQCTHVDGKQYLTAILQRTYRGSSGGDWDFTSGRSSKYSQASCVGTVGEPLCWPATAPIHISDGGGPSDQVKEEIVRTKIEEIIRTRYPPLNYHPLALPKSRGPDPDVQTNRILAATHRALNLSNPKLAEDCWLCMTLGTPMPLAIPPINSSVVEGGNCPISPPFRVQPVGFNTSACFQRLPINNSFDLDVGFITFTNCSSLTNYSQSLCPAPGQAFVCGGNMAYPALPVNWTGLCITAAILPDLDIIPGDEPVPLPHLEYIAGRSKRAVQLVPLLVGLGITGAVASGTAGLGVAVESYRKLSNQLIDDVQALSGTINDLQDQIDSLAEVVLQNRRGLDLLTAEQGGICLALQERCCFYANKSGIVRDKIKTLQEDLIKRRKELLDNPLWSGLNGFLPYLLPLLGPLAGLLIILAVGPCVFRALVNMIQSRTQDLRIMLLSTYYQPLPGEEGEESRI